MKLHDNCADSLIVINHYTSATPDTTKQLALPIINTSSGVKMLIGYIKQYHRSLNLSYVE
jgi:hypothetical protein